MGVGSPQMAEFAARQSSAAHKNATPVEAVSEVDACALVHELQVRQIELEMQNEELQHAYAAAQEASENYYDLFDFAPVAYFLWDAEGRILAVNLAGAALLGLNRKAMIETPFGQFVAQENRPAFADFCKQVLTTGLQQTCEIKLLCAGQAVYALVEGIAAPNHKGQGKVCRAAVIDITQRRFLEESLRDAHAMLAIRAAELARTLEQLHEEVQQRIETEASLERERQTLQDLLQAGDHERRLIGYEIHDGLAQHLAAASHASSGCREHQDTGPHTSGRSPCRRYGPGWRGPQGSTPTDQQWPAANPRRRGGRSRHCERGGLPPPVPWRHRHRVPQRCGVAPPAPRC